MLGVGVGEPATETSCREQSVLAAAVTAERQLDQTGRPRPMPPDLPVKSRHPSVSTVARQIVETCHDLGSELRDVDCSEYPCLAWSGWWMDRSAPLRDPLSRNIRDRFTEYP